MRSVVRRLTHALGLSVCEVGRYRQGPPKRNLLGFPLPGAIKLRECSGHLPIPLKRRAASVASQHGIAET
jgi:hypothetical protein